MLMGRVIRGDGLSPLEIVVYFSAVEEGKNVLASRVHEVLVDVIHIVVDK